MMRLNLNKISLLVALAFSLSFCNSQESTRKRALPDGVATTNQQGQGVVPFNLSEVSRLEKLLQQVEPVVIEQLAKEKGSINTALLYAQVITPLLDVVLNVDYLLDPDHRYLETATGIQLIPRLVVLFDQAVLLMYTEDPNHVMLKTLLPRMKSQILWDCDEDLRGTCSFISFYRGADSNNIVRIVRILHDQESQEEEKLRLVYAAFDLANRRLDENLRFMLLERLAASLSQDKSRTISQRRLSQDANLFANVLKINMDENLANSSERYIDLIRTVNPWLLSRNEDSPQSPAMTELLHLAAQNLIYAQEVSLLPVETTVPGPAGTPIPSIKPRQLSKELHEAVESLYYRVGTDYEQGVSFQKENIRGEWKTRFQNADETWKASEEIARLTDVQQEVYQSVTTAVGERIELFGQESKAILTSMGADVEFPADEYFFLVHQIYYEHYNIDDAAAFWQSTGKDQNRLMDAITSLIKLQVVNNIVYTNTRMNRFYGESTDTKIIELMTEAQKEAAEIRKAWGKTIDRSKTLQSFANRVVNKNIPANKQKVDQITSNVEALGKNIKYLVTYPSMYSLVHIFASQEMNDKIQTFFGEFTIDSLTVMKTFFGGGFKPLFNFGHDGNALNTTQVLYTFYYALMTEIFSTYSTNKKPLLKFSIEEFFKVVVKRLVLETENSLETATTSLQSVRENYSNVVDSLQQTCREERQLQAQEVRIHSEMQQSMGEKFHWQEQLILLMKPRTQAKNQISFLDLDSSVYDATASRPLKTGSLVSSTYSSSVTSALKNLKADFQKKNIMAKILLEIYRQYSKETGTADEIAGIIEEQFQDFKRLKAEYSETFFGMHDAINGCEWDFANRDRDIRQALIFREAQYWGELFDKVYDVVTIYMSSQREQVLGPLRIEQEADPSINELDVLQNISSSEAVRAQLNVVRDQFMVASTDPMFPQAYRERKGYTRFEVGRVTTFKLDTLARLKSYLNEIFPGQYEIFPVSNMETEEIYKENGEVSVNFNWSGVSTWSPAQKANARAQFVASGVRTFASQVPWAKTAVETKTIEEKGNILVSLYKLNKISINNEVNCEALDPSDEQFANDCRKVSAKEVIDHYEKFIHLMNIDERDEIVLNYLGNVTKYGENNYEKLIKKQKEHRLYSYYDLVYRRIFSDEEVTVAENTWFVPVLVEYVTSNQNLKGSTFIFPFPPELEDIFVNNYRPWLNNYFELNKEFLQEVKTREVTPFKFKYRTDRQFTVGDPAISTVAHPSEHLISSLIYEKFSGFVTDMNKNTNYYFSGTITPQLNLLKDVLNAPEGN